MFVTNEKNGIHTSDEAFKMATTDAIGTAAKYIGLAADVYMGHGDKYTTPENPKKPELTEAKIHDAAQSIKDGVYTMEQIKSMRDVSPEVEEKINNLLEQLS